MKSPILKSDEKKSNREFPGMCEPALNEQSKRWNARKRRGVAEVFEHWASQLILSAELMEKCGVSLNEPAEIIVPDVELQEEITGRTSAECLKLAVKLELWSTQIRKHLGLQKPKVLTHERLHIALPN
jgi:hypothetical protein